MRLERRTDVPLGLVLTAPLAAILVALILGSGLIALAEVNPLTAYGHMLDGAFGSRLAITETLTRATPLILTGLAAAVAFRAKLWNIGGEGQFYLGALMTAWLGHSIVVGLPTPLAFGIIILFGMLAGSALLAGPAFLRLRFGIDEVVTTLLLNFVVLLFVGLMIEGPMRDPLAFGWPQSVPVERSLRLPDLVDRSRLHVGLLIAIAAAAIVWLVLERTVFGMESKAAGLNARAASFAGISLPRTIMGTALLSGGLAGLAGTVEVLGVTGNVTTTLSPGFGYSGIVVAMLAALHPIGVVAAAVFVATIFVGADAMARATGVPSFIADVIMAVSLLCMLVALLFASYRIRR
ncbi:MAG: ABC transporter permease [Rhizobiales bacterium]|nr:ABC transporter permease [Hyphomicrobiales bacterium]MBO6699085.1 ABC transporter permease [Hyphomicrobiales bacterium]MBO6736623.1 ABC transporter permease [Hyphomicrobiales bacterium]MBO6912303.1 ABC transporter permease [Hyphomicrobiales bacterium]MBO6956549.1 ABC transporter permease [Hyphomicrobiales bacterium]